MKKFEKLGLEKFTGVEMEETSEIVGGGSPTKTHHCDGNTYNDKRTWLGKLKIDWDGDGKYKRDVEPEC